MDGLSSSSFTQSMSTASGPTHTTLVIGGTGKTGRRVVERLAAQGLSHRAGSRAGTPPFEWSDESTWQPALEGMTAAYVVYYPDLAFPGAAETVGTFFDFAVDNGVRRLVLLSGRGEEEAQVSERALQSSGADWTILQSTWLSQNFSEHFLYEPVLDGVIVLPAGDVAEPFVDAEDVADVAVAALSDDRHIGQVYELTGPRLLTFADAAHDIAEATGRDISYVSVTAEEYKTAAAAAGVPAEEVAPLIDLFAIVLDGRNARLADGVQRALGRQPRDFRDYARATAASGVWNIVAEPKR
jgi:uncharacterized protein YbjT (DUF2867 family)